MAIDRRYYRVFYTPDGHQCVLQHSNRVCLVCLGPSHPLLARHSSSEEEEEISEEISNIEFKTIGGKKKTVTSETNGGGGGGSNKKEKANNKLMPNSVICTVSCKSGESFQLRSCIKGTLLEVNDQIIDQPSLLQSEVCNNGGTTDKARPPL